MSCNKMDLKSHSKLKDDVVWCHLSASSTWSVGRSVSSRYFSPTSLMYASMALVGMVLARKVRLVFSLLEIS